MYNPNIRVVIYIPVVFLIGLEVCLIESVYDVF